MYLISSDSPLGTRVIRAGHSLIDNFQVILDGAHKLNMDEFIGFRDTDKTVSWRMESSAWKYRIWTRLWAQCDGKKKSSSEYSRRQSNIHPHHTSILVIRRSVSASLDWRSLRLATSKYGKSSKTRHLLFNVAKMAAMEGSLWKMGNHSPIERDCHQYLSEKVWWVFALPNVHP